MEKNKDKVKLNDDLLDQVSGGYHGHEQPYTCDPQQGGCGKTLYCSKMPNYCPFCEMTGTFVEG